MRPKHTYYGFTTPQQRKLLFETWQATGRVTQACQTAHVSRGLFYHWKARFDAYGYAGLEAFASRRAHQLNRTDELVVQRVIALRQAHPAWGKRRLADELAAANHWVRVISPNTVRRILAAAGLWPEKAAKKKAGAA